MKKRSKRYKDLIKFSTKGKKVDVKDILDLVKKTSTTKFDESVDVSMRINLKQTKGGDFNLRTVIKLPNGSGKQNIVAVLCEADKLEDAKKSGAEVFGTDDLLEKIGSGKFNFNKLVCTPAMMGKLGKHGKVLGPKGLMPNPKLGSVSDNVKKAVTDSKSGQAEIRNDKDGNIGVSIGKKSFSDENLLKNFNTILDTLEKEKGNLSLKGDLIKNIFVTSSMGVSYKVKMGKAI